MRFRIAALYQAPEHARRLEGIVSSQPGIVRTTASTVTATLLVLYDPALDNNRIVERIAALCGIPPELTEVPVEPGRPAEPSGAGVAEPPSSGPRSSPLTQHLHRLFGGHPPPAQCTVTTSFDPRGWHAMDAETVRHALGLEDLGGLPLHEVDRRLQRYGPNLLGAVASRSELAILLDQLVTVPVGMLVVSALVSVLTGGVADAAVILAVVAINSVVGWLTERQAERAIRGLAELRPQHCRVCRDGVELPAKAADLVELGCGGPAAHRMP
jgi:Ca2+-transporting ATPase